MVITPMPSISHFSRFAAVLLLVVGWHFLVCHGTSGANPARGVGQRTVVAQNSENSEGFNVARLVRQHLDSIPGYEPGFIISKGDVAPIFASLQRAKWDTRELARIYAAVVDDGHFLVQQLRSPQGYKFMKTAGKFPQNYDRMDRVSQAKGGRQAIINTVQLTNGASFWNPNAKPGFSNTAKMLPTRGGKRRSAAEFSHPTGKIYTESQLVKQLVSVQPKKPNANSASDRRR